MEGHASGDSAPKVTHTTFGNVVTKPLLKIELDGDSFSDLSYEEEAADGGDAAPGADGESPLLKQVCLKINMMQPEDNTSIKIQGYSSDGGSSSGESSPKNF